MKNKKEFYEEESEEELVKSFIESLELEYDYTPFGVGKALAFLYVSLDELRNRRRKNG